MQQTVNAPCSNGDCWQPPGGGAFEFRISVPAGADRSHVLLRVWGLSTTDGSPIHVVQYPLR